MIKTDFLLHFLTTIIYIIINLITLSFFCKSIFEYDLVKINNILNMNEYNFLILHYLLSIFTYFISFELSCCIIFKRLPQKYNIYNGIQVIDSLISYPSPNSII